MILVVTLTTIPIDFTTCCKTFSVLFYLWYKDTKQKVLKDRLCLYKTQIHIFLNRRSKSDIPYDKMDILTICPISFRTIYTLLKSNVYWQNTSSSWSRWFVMMIVRVKNTACVCRRVFKSFIKCPLYHKSNSWWPLVTSNFEWLYYLYNKT